MGYSLGIDVGTTFTSAAIWRDERVEVVALESHRVAIPSVVFAGGDHLVFGTPAVNRGATQPSGVAREFKRRLGDPVPLVLSGAPYSADRLVALFAQWVVTAVSEQLGEGPERVVVTHPANWTEFQLHLLTNALEQVDLGAAGQLSEPQAAAIDFGAAAHLEPGELVVVYDLGGGTFDVALLRRETVGFSHVGEPVGVERLGGIDFDEAVFQHVVRNVPDEVVAQARSEDAGRMALAQLRRACIEAKEGLSSEVAVDVPVVLPGVTSTVRLTRTEFEEMIRPMLHQTVELVAQVITRNQITASDLSAVLLVGGSSRIPAVAELVRERLGAPVRVDAHPKLVVARGAARWAETLVGPQRLRAHRKPRRRRRAMLAAAGAVALAAAGGGVWYATAGSGDGSGTADVTDAPRPTASADGSIASAPSTLASTPPEVSTSLTTPPSLPPGETVVGIEPIGMVTIENGSVVDGHPVTAMTALVSDREPDRLLAVSDTDGDGFEAALFEVVIDLSDGTLDDGDVTFESATTLLGPDGRPYGSELDVEGITITEGGTLVVVSEGLAPDEFSSRIREPFLHELDREGRFVREWSVPEWYSPDPEGVTGIRIEGGLNSLFTLSGEPERVVTAVEYSLLQDEESTAVDGEKWARLLALDASSTAPVAEYAYPLDPTSVDAAGGGRRPIRSGLLDLTPVDGSRTLIALERSMREEPSWVRLYEVALDPTAAAEPSSSGPNTTLVKRELAVIETRATWQSLALGPLLPDGRRSLIVLGDTNNNPRSPTVILAFAVRTEPVG